MSGPTGSGKTTALVDLLKRGMFDPLPKHVFVFHGEEQKLYEEFPKGTVFIKGWDTNKIESIPPDSMVIVDDLMTEVKDCKVLSKMFTKMSHHRLLTVIWLTQNLFPKGKECRDISLNSQYILLFRNPRDQAQLRHLSSQMFPGKTADFINEFEKATADPYDPMMINLRQDQPANDRVMRFILSSRPQYVTI